MTTVTSTLQQVQMQATIETSHLKRGAPTLTSLWKWTATLRTLQQQEIKLKGHPVRQPPTREAKGKGIDRTPCRDRVELSSTEASRSEATNSSSIVTEAATTAKAIEPPTRKPPEPPSAQTTVVPAATTVPTIPVQVPVSKLERVRTLKFRSRLELNAQEIGLSTAEFNKLRAFSAFVGTANQRTLFGRQLPPCHRYAVSIELDGSGAQTYICIDGLTREEDIRDFHAVMSQRKYRKYYEPWKLCFKMVEISYTSGEDVDLDLGHDELTLCGTLLREVRFGETRISTIGGLLEVDGCLVALTTSFAPCRLPFGSEQDGEGDVTVSSVATTLNDIDFPEDIAEALVFKGEKSATYLVTPPTINDEKAKDSDANPASMFQPNIAARISPAHVHGKLGHKADCWLIPVRSQYALPNMVWFDNPVDKDQQPSRHYITDFCRNPSLASVKVRAGASGAHSGTMSVGPSLIDGEDEPLEVWTLHLDDGTDLIPGDSGSWVVVTPTQARCEVVGSVVARSPGKAYIVLLSHQLEAIRGDYAAGLDEHSGLSRDRTTAFLPSPLRPLLGRAQDFYMVGDVVNYERSLRMIISIAKENVLPHDPLAVAFRGVLGNQSGSVQQTDLEKLIAIHGLGLERVLQSTLRADNGSDLALVSLGALYKTVEKALRDKNDAEPSRVAAYSGGLPPHFSESSTAWESATTKVAFTGRSSFSAPTKEPPPTQLDLTPIQDATTPHQTSQRPLPFQARPTQRRRRTGSGFSANTVLLLSFLTGVVAGAGAGLWQLGVLGFSFTADAVF
ncbi:hypothetical protein F5144DRAFT_611768 [Chaetomium tenue]|uniref:Uncharacterized protein n=1 Tax=Chaetomium tenue TaxID=1854479 RepID=A0ACB7PJE8_9PEZI|nr:hypothetical protein F5144DRAFT_611768 [Chaetomium globosum]